MGKSLLPEDVRGAYQVEQWNFHAWAKTIVEAIQEFRLRKNNVASKFQKQISDVEALPTSTSYSRMNYERLRKIADDDILAANMSNEEYEALSVAMWRRFSAENGLK
ncbi:MAG: hypothetical protein ABSB14_14360 [Candidatus Sulfotelmatobacter sp.]